MTRAIIEPTSHVPSVLRAARSLVRSGQPKQALRVLSHGLRSVETFDPAHALSLTILLNLGRRRDAEKAFNTALSLERASADAVEALAFFARRFDRHQLANSLYRQAVELSPDDARNWYNLAASARNLGAYSEASSACNRALSLDDQLMPAVLLRSEIARATDSSNHIDDLRRRRHHHKGGSSEMFICYALGKELHDLGRYKQAFEAFSSGSSIRRRNLKYDVSEDERKMLRIRQAFSSVQGGVERDPTRDRHIFIIGLPRSGTTLVERILGGAPGVRSNGETDNLSNALMSCVSSTSGDIFDRCANAPANAVAQAYDRAAAHDDFSGVIIEKLPLNFLYAGAIARSFPSSPIVWVRRHPVDNCFAMFRTLFGAGYPFSYDFEELARYYSAYLGLMRHWKRTIPNRMTEVDYDELVVSPRDVAKPLTERCGLPWSDDLLDLARNRTVSLTASASQVRGPIYASSSGIRREYESQLEPLSRLLKQNGVDLSLVE